MLVLAAILILTQTTKICRLRRILSPLHQTPGYSSKIAQLLDLTQTSCVQMILSGPIVEAHHLLQLAHHVRIECVLQLALPQVGPEAKIAI